MGFKDDDVQEFPDGGDFDELEISDSAIEEKDTSNDEQIVPDDGDIVEGVQEDEETIAEVEDEVEAKADSDEEPETEAKTEEGETEEEPKAKQKRFNPAEYSKSVQKRINREVRKREELRAENEALNERLSKLEQNQVQAKNDGEVQLMNGRISNAQSMHTKLMEDGEYAKAAEVLNDITDMKIYTRDLQRTEGNSQVPQQTQQSQQQQFDIPDAQMEWMQGNKRFNSDANYTNYVNDEYDRLLEEGYAADDSGLYSELDSRLGRTSAQPAAPVVPAQSKRPKAAPTPNIGEQAPPSNKKRLDKTDLKRMEDWGLDPNDVDARKEYLRNKSA